MRISADNTRGVLTKYVIKIVILVTQNTYIFNPGMSLRSGEENTRVKFSTFLFVSDILYNFKLQRKLIQSS